MHDILRAAASADVFHNSTFFPADALKIPHKKSSVTCKSWSTVFPKLYVEQVPPNLTLCQPKKYREQIKTYSTKEERPVENLLKSLLSCPPLKQNRRLYRLWL